MFNHYRHVMLLILTTLTVCAQAPQQPGAPADIIVVNGSRTAYPPFASFKAPVFEITNSKLNIAVTDRNGNMLQVNGIDTELLKRGILSRNQFRTVMIMNSGTCTDDADQNPRSLLEIKCENNRPNTPITVGLKTTVFQNGKKLRVYATLSGTIPSYNYERTNSTQ
jgi:hypothetical protein